MTQRSGTLYDNPFIFESEGVKGEITLKNSNFNSQASTALGNDENDSQTVVLRACVTVFKSHVLKDLKENGFSINQPSFVVKKISLMLWREGCWF